MKRLFVLLVLVAAGVACLGFYLGWFQLTTETTSDGKSNITVTVDKDKIHDDKQKAEDKAKSIERDVKEKTAETVNKTR
ncbi:MAG: hypothetical protein JWN40_3054 [Phycisphaerales bacterium]|nr:hypothetical protein [Phycisphaerales bacterium]